MKDPLASIVIGGLLVVVGVAALLGHGRSVTRGVSNRQGGIGLAVVGVILVVLGIVALA